MKLIANAILRWLFIVLFFTTAIGKLLDNRGFAEVLKTYHLFPEFVLLPLALGISLGELILAWMLFAKKQKRVVSYLVLVINAGYLVLASVTYLRGIALSNCGCFGVFLARPLTVWTLVEDAGLVSLSALFVRLEKTV